MTCSHTRQRWFTLVSTDTPATPCRRLVCVDCMHMLTIGPSNDDIPSDELAFAVVALDVIRLWEPRQQSRALDRLAAEFGVRR